MGKLKVIEHPLLQHKLSILRNKDTGVKEFREIVGEISTMMCYEVTRELPTKEITVITPVGEAKAKEIDGKHIAVVPILRAGIGMVDGILNLMPNTKMGHIGLYRDPESLQPVQYYCKMPGDIVGRDVIVVDPMLATGGTAVAAIQFIKNYEVKDIRLMVILASEPGIKAVHEAHPDVEIICAAVDKELDSHGYIVPGLGDAGDRMFGTK